MQLITDPDAYIEKELMPLSDFEKALKERWQMDPSLFTLSPSIPKPLLPLFQGGSDSRPVSPFTQGSPCQLSDKKFFKGEAAFSVVPHPRYLPCFSHTHRFFELFYVLRGRCQNHLPGFLSHSMQAGDLCLMVPETSHAVESFSDDFIALNLLVREGTFEDFFFRAFPPGSILSRFFSHAFACADQIPYLLFHTGNEAVLSVTFLRLLEELKAPAPYQEQLCAHICAELFIGLLRLCGDRIETGGKTCAQKDQTVGILTSMQEQFDSITLSELSERFHYSRRQTARLIERATGRSFTENIKALRLEHLCALLSETDLSLEEIASRSGFESPAYLSRFFKKAAGISPSAWRKARRREG